MNNLSNDDIVECPLCMEPLEVDDLNFYPCTCGYQICRFCWHRIRTDENQLCPACRKEYPENPADFKPLTQEEMVAFKFQKRQRDQKRKQEITENRKHLANVRVVQKNLVFVVGLPPRLADAEILKKHEYFGKYGKIHKVVINPSTTYAGVQGPSASAYVTYVHNTDALRAIQSVNNIMIDGRLIKTSLGTTKYCSHFMKNQQCPKGDCMYLHELGDPEASFTKEEMHQGKHQDYEKRLHDVLIATSGTSTAGGLVSAVTTGAPILNNNTKVAESNGKNSGILPSSSSKAVASAANEVVGNTSSSAAVAVATAAAAVNGQQTEAWPCLSISPVNKKETVAAVGPKSKKERNKQEKTKPEKNGKTKNKNSVSTTNNGTTTSKDVSEKCENAASTNSKSAAAVDCPSNPSIDKSRAEKDRERKHSSISNTQSQPKEEQQSPIADVETNKVSSKTKTSSEEVDNKPTTVELEQIDGNDIDAKSEEPQLYVSNSNISNSSISSSSSSSSSSNSSSTTTTTNNGPLINETADRKSPTHSFHKSNSLEESVSRSKSEKSELCPFTESIERSATADNYSVFGHKNKNLSVRDLLEPTYKVLPFPLNETEAPAKNGDNQLLAPAEVPDMSKLSLFDSNSFFGLNVGGKIPTPSSMMLPNSNKLLEDPLRDQVSGRIMPNLPDLINGIDGYQNNINCTNDWEDAFKSVILKTNKQMEEKLQQHQQLQQHLHNHHQMKQQEDLRKLQELQKRNILLNSMRVSQLNNGPLGASDLNRHSNFMGPQNPLLQHPGGDAMQNPPPLGFETNMSKFFDFHKHQQQKMQNYGPPTGGLTAGLCDNFHMMSLLENKPMNSQLLGHSSLFSSQLQQQQQQQQQQQKQKLYGKMDPMMHHQQLQPQPLSKQNVSVPSIHNTPQNHMKNQFLQNSSADDDLGFDPFIETQKALAELIENEEEQQQQQQQQHNPVSAQHSNPIAPPHKQPQPPMHQDQMLEYMQRLRMPPPPGYSHLNSNLGGYGVDPRLHANQNSKILPFMNLSGGNNGGGGANPQHMPPQQQHPLQIPNPNVWSTHLGNMQQQQQSMGVGHGLRHDNCNPAQNLGGNQKAGYTGNDWTAMDPAILSFRQFSFPQQNQMGPQQLPPQQQQGPPPPPQDMFLQHLSQQTGGGFGVGGVGIGAAQSQHNTGGGNSNIPNAGVLNSQSHHSSQQAQVDANVQGMLEFLKTHQFV